MTDGGGFRAPAIRATHIVHQEGVIGLLAVVGLALSERGLVASLLPRTGLVSALVVGVGAGAAIVVVVWLARRLPPVARLERWQRGVVDGWTATDAVAVALVSGLAEEALIRAVLQPVIGLLAAAAVFAFFHVVPERRLWFWPLFALGAGVAFGALFDGFGYPAAAAAHVTVNLVALLRLAGGDVNPG